MLDAPYQLKLCYNRVNIQILEEDAMNARNKVLLVLALVVVGAVTLACSCGPLSSLLNSAGSEPMAGLAGVWRDNAENTVHTIEWNGTTYHVVSSIDDEHGNCPVTSEYWNGTTFSWTYYVADTDVSVTIVATSVSGSSMYNSWSSTNGNSGTDVFTRE
jgi:hypothetical protein